MSAVLRSMSRAVVQFGLVAVPCKLYLAADPGDSGIHLLHRDCLSRIQQKLCCPRCSCEVTRADTIRGYPVGGGRYVVITDDEWAALCGERLGVIAVEYFVTLAEAARLEVYARQTYYLAPDGLGGHSFALLCATLEDTGLAAVARLAIRERTHLATIRVLENGLLLTTLAWPEEIRPIADLDLPSHASLPATELKLARQLVLAMQHPFEPAAHHDESRDALRRLVESKVDGATFALPEAAPSPVIADLMAALEASVAAARAARVARAADVPEKKRRRTRVTDAASGRRTLRPEANLGGTIQPEPSAASSARCDVPSSTPGTLRARRTARRAVA